MSQRQTKSRMQNRRDRSRTSGLITAGVIAGVVSVPALAGPSGEQVVHGSARFDRAGNHTTITTSDRAIINYDSFNLNQYESVRFMQPGASSRVLNRIQGVAPTLIDGSVFANGNVYFVNRAGVFFGQNAVINVGGIYAAAGNITNQDFLNNVNQFTDLSGSVINEGTINATSEAHLVGRRVANFGRIVAPNGMVSMTAGDDVLLGQRGGRVFARISGDASNAGAVGVENHGVIDAGSGQVLAGVGDHFALALYDTSVIRGDSVRIAGSARSTVTVRGDIDASNATGSGGDIEILGGRIGVYGADLDASGTTGGGNINIGGDERGLGERLRAEVTLVDSGTSLSVDATSSGDAGRVVAWSDGATVFRGKVSGNAPGKGGFTEVSSLGYLEFNGSIDLRGAAQNGTLLLDPKNIIVTATNQGGATDINDVNSFAVDPNATTLIHDQVLEGWLNGGILADIVFQANNDFVFNPFASVTQNAGTNSLRIFAGRRVVFGPNSNLIMGGGSLFAVANAVNEAGFVAASRDAGLGSIILANGSNIEIQGAGQVADFTVDTGAMSGSIVMVGELLSPTINLTTIDATSQVLFVEDGNGLTDQIGLGGSVIVNAGGQVLFTGNAGEWSFGSLDVTSPEILFDSAATGVAATAGSLRFASPVFNSATSGLFTFNGPAAIEGTYTSAGAALFTGTLDLEGGIDSNGDLTFQDAVTLTGDAVINQLSAGNIEFASTLGATNALMDDLTVNLNGNGDLSFRGQIGTFASQLGDIRVTGLNDTLTFDDFVFADSLTSSGIGGTVNLGNGDDQFTLQGNNGAGAALAITGADVNLGGNVLAVASGVSIEQLLTVAGDFSIGALNPAGTISLGSVLLDASGGNANLTLNTFGGADIFVADGAGETIRRDASGANSADLNINSSGGDVTLGNVLANGAADNFLNLLEIQAGAGEVNYVGTRYAAETLTLNAAAHNLADADSVFGDDAASTAVTQDISFLGGNVNVAAGRMLELNALGAGGNASVFGVRTNGAGSSLVFRATDTASLGTGDTVGDAGNALASIDVISDDVTIGNGIFATDLLLDPTLDFLTFGAVNFLGMMVDAGEIANLNLGAIGTLSLGSNDIANFGAYNGITVLTGGTALTSVGQLNAFGNTSVSGSFVTNAAGVNFFGPTTLNAGSTFQTTDSQVRFFSSLAAFNNASLVDTGNGLISFVNTVPVPGGVEVGAAIDAAFGGGSLAITTGAGGTVTLFDVGPASQLATLTVDGGTINFRGQRYDAAAQTYTADAFNLLGDGPGTPGNAISFSGVTPGMNVQTLSFLDLGGGADATVQVAAGVAVDAMLDGAFLSEAEILGTGGAESLTVDAGSIQLDRDLGNFAPGSELGSVSLTAANITAANVFTSGDQTYTLDTGAGQLTLNGGFYRSLGASTISINGTGADSVLLNAGGPTDVVVADGGAINLNVPSIVGAGNSLVVTAGATGTITFAPGISISDAGQAYTAGIMNFLGSAMLTSTSANSAISFFGGTVNTAGDLTVQTTGASSGVNFVNAPLTVGGDLTVDTLGILSAVDFSGGAINATGDLTLETAGANSGITLTTAPLTAGGNLFVRSTGDTSALNLTGGAINSTGDLTLETAGTNSGITLTTVPLTAGGSLIVRSTGDTSALNLTGGAINSTGDLTLDTAGANSGITLTTAPLAGGTSVLVRSTGDNSALSLSGGAVNSTAVLTIGTLGTNSGIDLINAPLTAGGNLFVASFGDNSALNLSGGAINTTGDLTISTTGANSDVALVNAAATIGGLTTITTTGLNAGIALTNAPLSLGGNLLLQTTGANSAVNAAGGAITLNGFDVTADASGVGGDVSLANLIAAGGETVTIRANGLTTLAGAGGAGLALLDLQTNTLAINGLTTADSVLINTLGFNPQDISVGDDAALTPGTLNISNASLANLTSVAGGTNSLTIGNAAYAGQILIGDATINRDVAFTTGGSGIISLASTGLQGTGGLTSIAMTAPEIRLGGAIQSNAGAFALALNGPVNVSGTADIDTNGGAILFADAINGLNPGTGFLDVNTAGGTITMREDLGVIGATNALGQLSLAGAPTLRLVGANTSGDQFFQTTGGAITLLDGAAFTAGDNGDIAFASNVAALGDAQATTGAAGSITFQGLLDGVGSPAQTVTLLTGAGGSVNLAQVGGPAGLGSLDVTTGTVTLSGNLSLLQNLSIMADQTLLSGDQSMSAQSITLATDIDSNGAAANLSLENAITTLINGRLGGNSPLASFTSSQNGTTTLTGGVFSNGLALFRNGVIISGDAIVQSFGNTAADGVRFLSTIDGTTAGADSLTLLTDLTGGELAGISPNGLGIVDANVPVISLFGDVGSNVALGTLGLNFGVDVNGNAIDGRAFVPANATIVLGDSNAFFANGTTTDLTINADSLFMGLREKMVALGSLTASGSNARLGDIATINNLAVNYDAVTVLLREAADIFDPTTGLVAQDSGTDFVAGGTLQFGTIVAFDGPGGAPEFSLPGGDPSIDANVGAFLFKSLDSDVNALVNGGGVVVDVRADGPTNTNVAEALAGAIPQEQAAEPVVTDVPLSQVALDALVDLGIIIKQPGENLYLIDLPDDIAGAADSTRVSRRRLEPTLVNSLVSDYDAAVKTTVTATPAEAGEGQTETVSVVRRDTEIKSILDDAWDAFVEAEGDNGTAADFYAFVRSNAGQFSKAVVEIERLQEVVSAARVLGLTEREISAVKTKMFTMMQPNMGARAFRDLIDATPAALLGVR